MSEVIVSAIAACARSDSEDSCERAYTSLLWAAGNNHAGTYGCSVLALIDGLGPILRTSGPWSQRAALEAMIDWYGSFESETGEQLAAELRDRIDGLEREIHEISKSPSAATSSACQLLALIREPAA